MAGRAMKVAVLEGDFVALCNLGLPFSVSYQLQEKGLKLPDALWTIRSSAGGFSVSLFWPNSSTSLKKRQRRRKRAKAKSLANSKQCNQDNQVISSKEPVEKPASKIPTPIRAHQHLELAGGSTSPSMPTQDAVSSQILGSSNSSSSTAPSDSSILTCDNEFAKNEVDLATCLNVSFELRDGQAGVRFEDSASNTSGWTPVVGRRKKRPRLPPHVLRRFPPDHPLRQSHTSHCSDSSSEEDETLVIPQTADVYFDVVDGTPGLQIETRNTSRWTPIACRTRSKSKQCS